MKTNFLHKAGYNIRFLTEKFTPRVGFEPALPQRGNGFRDRRLTTTIKRHV
jgi:hypothetical protein